METQTQPQTAGARSGPPPLQQLAVDVDWTGDDLTLNERIAVEDVCGGRPFEAIRDEGRTTYFRALAWVVLRRSDPRLTLEEAGVLHLRFEAAD